MRFTISKDPTVLELRKQAHMEAARIWGRWGDAFEKRREMYQWLQINTRTGHISTLRKGELEKLIKQLKRMYAKKK